MTIQSLLDSYHTFSTFPILLQQLLHLLPFAQLRQGHLSKAGIHRGAVH